MDEKRGGDQVADGIAHRSVLLIDDDAEMVAVLRRVIEQEGPRVAEEALRGGARCYLEKSFRMAEIVEAIANETRQGHLMLGGGPTGRGGTEAERSP
jgi:DNA-binding response OmpR family regulator